MRYLYTRYYKEENRGFTDAEFQSTCELIAGSSLDHIFEYVYTVKEFDYNRYLKYAGLHLNKVRVEKKDGNMAWKYNLKVGKKLRKNQVELLNYWMGK
jgi:predicted metalloprotease with PDZ domain